MALSSGNRIKFRYRPDFRRRLCTNYGNRLDSIGRSFEALFAYDKALSAGSDFPMALGNKGMALRFFADCSGEYREQIYAEAYELVDAALQSPRLTETAHPGARSQFEKTREKIISEIGEPSALSSLEHPVIDVGKLSEFERFCLDFYSRHRLWMNVHVHETRCQAAVCDPIFIRMVLKPSERDRFFQLAKLINQIKEDCATARLLVAGSQFRQQTLDQLSHRTSLVQLEFGGRSDLYCGLLKTGFKAGYDVLDKIAGFINAYCQLELAPDRVGFVTFKANSIWHDGGALRGHVANSENPSLWALYDIARDFNITEDDDGKQRAGEYTALREMRNSLTHRHVALYREKPPNSDGMAWHDALARTIELLQIVNAAVVYLINFVNSEERRRVTGFPVIARRPDTSQQF